MKKIDKLVLESFLGPFILTFLVVVFILLMQHMLKYFDDIIGKDLGWDVLGQLLFYFAIFMTPVALPLAVLLSSLIAFGNLGEHFELTAIKSAGISLIRTLQPIFLFVLILTGLAFYANNNLVPKAALEAYSLLYDIKQKKPALDLREGAFYNGIPDISIKVNKKFPKDDAALKEIIVYDHRKNDGNKEVTIADSGRMSTILNERYLKFELFNGYRYTEGANADQELAGKKNVKGTAETLTRSKFSKTQVVFDLSSFQLSRTDKKWFQGNRIMRDVNELDHDIDSIKREILQQRLNFFQSKQSFFAFYNKKNETLMPDDLKAFKVKRDSIERRKYVKNDPPEPLPQKDSSETKATQKIEKVVQPPAHVISKNKEKRKRDSIRSVRGRPTLAKVKKAKVKPVLVAKPLKPVMNDSTVAAKADSLFNMQPTLGIVQGATNMARQVKTQIENSNTNRTNYTNELWTFEIQWHKILASSMACIAMFLIGAPLGAIIKKGGLGMPFLVSILFFIIYYLLSMQGEKLAKQGTVTAMVGVWSADFILLIVGLVFLRQARVDARLFEADFYSVMLDKVKRWFAARKIHAKASA
jgi:lipopolysaccharide export system permease protein